MRHLPHLPKRTRVVWALCLLSFDFVLFSAIITVIRLQEAQALVNMVLLQLSLWTCEARTARLGRLLPHMQIICCRLVQEGAAFSQHSYRLTPHAFCFAIVEMQVRQHVLRNAVGSFGHDGTARELYLAFSRNILKFRCTLTETMDARCMMHRFPAACFG